MEDSPEEPGDVSSSEDSLRLLVERSPQGLVVVDGAGHVRLANHAARELLGERVALDLSFGLAMAPSGTIEIQVEESGPGPTVELTFVDTEWLGEPAQLIGVRDITTQLQRERQLFSEILHDGLTRLPNRPLFINWADHRIAQHRDRPGPSCAVLLIDLDSFTMVNDSFGRDVGDEVLRAAADRLSAEVRPGDSVARVGGDEFAVLVGGIGQPEDAMHVAERLLRAFAEPFVVDGGEAYCPVSIGIAVHLPGLGDAEQTMRDAGIALRHAQAEGGSRHALFDPEMRGRVVDRLGMQTDLRRAIDRDELLLQYQPILDIRSWDIVGLEALLRWQHPDHGWMSPARFLPAAAEAGLLGPINEWVIAEVCRQITDWVTTHDDITVPPVSVNMSPQDLTRPDGVERFIEQIHRSDMPTSMVRVEITEGAIIESPTRAREALFRLADEGIVIHLDDFGTGYSPLTYLQQYPISGVKIDLSFVQGLPDNPLSLEIVRAVLALADSLGLEAIAEGLETSAQLDTLLALGGQRAQGFLFAHPLSAEEVPLALKAGQLPPEEVELEAV